MDGEALPQSPQVEAKKWLSHDGLFDFLVFLISF